MKGAPIKPGALCIIRAAQGPTPNCGKIVEVIKLASDADYVSIGMRRTASPSWVVRAKGLMALYASGWRLFHDGTTIIARQTSLIPISDPDADVTEINEKELTA